MVVLVRRFSRSDPLIAHNFLVYDQAAARLGNCTSNAGGLLELMSFTSTGADLIGRVRQAHCARRHGAWERRAVWLERRLQHESYCGSVDSLHGSSVRRRQ